MKFKELFKGLTVSVMVASLLSIGVVQSKAANAAVTLTGAAASTNVIVTGANHLNSLTFANGTAVAMIVPIFDAPHNTNMTYAVASYTNYTPYVTNFSTLYTNIFGFVTNYVVTNALARFTNMYAPTNVGYRMIGRYTVPANSTLTIDFSSLQFNTYGIVVTNGVGTNLTISADYNLQQ